MLEQKRWQEGVPELPEVETLRLGLVKEAVGRRICAVSVANPKVLKGQSEAEFRDRAVGRYVLDVRRRGKYLLFPLGVDTFSSSSIILCLHLKMRGSVLLKRADEALGRYGAMSVALDNGVALHYEDMWAWGEWRALAQEQASLLAELGDEPLEASWDAGEFARKLSHKRVAIKTVLLDQKIVAGVGNIYADEALFRARLAPTRVAASLTEKESEFLAEMIREVLTEAVALGGTQGDYVNLYGQQGRYVPRVYDREGEACPRCTEPLEKIKLGGRGTTFCPACQY
jgi:formamidopyrimidine-DNA glycosylase